MNKRIGIPQALFYHRYSPAWKTFFTELDCEVVESGQSTKEVIDAGVKLAPDEACLPVKLFLGHVKKLKNKVDYLFIPRVVSIKNKEYICPKFMGLPDMVRYSIDDLPLIIDTTVDLKVKKSNLVKSVLEIGELLDKDYWKISKACWKGWRALKKHRQSLKETKNEEAQYKIAILGHEYIIYDSHLSMNLIEKLRGMGVEVVTPEMLTPQAMRSGLSNLSKDMFWTLGKKMMGAAHYFFSSQDIDGIIQLTAFGCGPDSLVGEMIEREAKKRDGQAFMTLNLDEHTGEAGLVTRLEAFVDMIQWEGV
ncbi:acyl-CoA dehydratase activase-related protein [Natroniella sp. ANB-PHB2]|uniref:acyl-CoA dehydratase activase-related protein n=1 Tax=Natroniella sp. ANB-PHB2 TaxID=3384444 RepID=UPI0038D4CA77